MVFVVNHLARCEIGTFNSEDEVVKPDFSLLGSRTFPPDGVVFRPAAFETCAPFELTDTLEVLLVDQRDHSF